MWLVEYTLVSHILSDNHCRGFSAPNGHNEATPPPYLHKFSPFAEWQFQNLRKQAARPLSLSLSRHYDRVRTLRVCDKCGDIVKFRVQRSAKRLVSGCEKFLLAAATLFCMALPGSCLARFTNLLAGLCTCTYEVRCGCVNLHWM